MRKTSALLSILLCSLLLNACSSDGDDVAVGSTVQVSQNFSLNIPEDWRKIFKEDFANTIPPETTALYLKKISGDDFIQNTNVVKESINTDATSLEYAKANLLLGSKALLDYRPLSTEEATIGNVKTVIHLFRARNQSTDPIRHFTQSYFVRDQIGYTVTCISKDEDPVQQATCDTIIKSFRFL